MIQYGARIISSEEADVRVERYRSMVVRSLSRGDPIRMPHSYNERNSVIPGRNIVIPVPVRSIAIPDCD